jgi:penicillin-binding protein 1C
VIVLWSGLLAACNQAKLPTTGDLLGPRAASDPLTAVEGYLQQYQPGPLPRVFQTTRLYDRHHTLLAERFNEGQRTWVALPHISPHLIHATISTEDATFYSNSGVDPISIVKALFRNAQAGQIVSGGSTITMQLARNLFLGPDQRYDQSVDRKLLEAGLAQELTTLYSKDEIMEMYLNLLNYSNLAYGPEAAAQLYFGKPAAELTLAEAAMLAGIPQQPANLNPFTNLEGVRARQRVVLDLIVRHGYLSKAEADWAYQQPLVLKAGPDRPPTLAPHFVQYVLEELDQHFGAGFSQRAGFQITTTLDLPMQQLGERLIAEKVDELQAQFGMSNAALVAIKPNSGELLALVGSADFYDPAIAGQVNVAISQRQPGSAIKPILYATALQDNLVSPATVLWDVPVTYSVSAGQIYAPHNYDNRFHGPVTVRSALANSYNVPTVKLLAALGVPRMLAGARSLGVRSLNQPAEWYGLSLTLGGGEVSLLDLTNAYHTLASAGRFFPARAILSISVGHGAPSQWQMESEPSQVISPGVAFLVSDILSDNEARTPMFGADSNLRLSQPAAAKTGTTTDFRDNWSIGYTRYLVAGVWAGNSDGRPMRNTSGLTGAAPIWHDFMQAVLDDPALLATLTAPSDPNAWAFTPPADIEERPVCPPGLICRKGGEYFTAAWLGLSGEQGPLADSVERTPSAPVYVQQGDGTTQQVGFCRLDGAAERNLLKLSAQPGLLPLSSAMASEHSENSAIIRDDEPDASSATGLAVTTDPEQLQVVAWALRHSTPVNLGHCEALKQLAPRALALTPQAGDQALRVLVDLAAASSMEVQPVASGGAVEIAAIGPGLELASVLNSGRYRLATPIMHDANCPGQYIMGRVVDALGAPLAGITIKLQDQWGNQASTVSKSGTVDFGQFDFPIPSSSPHQLEIWVVDGSGAPASLPITIQHRSGDTADAPCHHVVIQKG